MLKKDREAINAQIQERRNKRLSKIKEKKNINEESVPISDLIVEELEEKEDLFKQIDKDNKVDKKEIKENNLFGIIKGIVKKYI